MKMIVSEHFHQLQELYRDLTIDLNVESGVLVSGTLNFSASYNGTTLEDSFQIEILIPDDYPESPPLARETGGKIPENFHKLEGNYLCLAAPVEVRKTFKAEPTLSGFVRNLVVPYLFSFCHKKKFGDMPYGELAHGDKGIYDYYSELFQATSELETLHFLKILAEGNYKGHFECPCGSGERIRHCHGPLIIEMSHCQTQAKFLADFSSCILQHLKAGNLLPVSLKSKPLIKLIGKENQWIYEKRKSKKK